MEITLIRHTAVDVPPGVCYGQTDVPLKASFEQEAAAVLAQLDAQTKAEGAFDKVFTSPLSRCMRLAAYCGYADAERDERLKEVCFGSWEMQPFMLITDPRLKDWYQDCFNVAPTGGESFQMLYERVAAFLDELKKQEYQRVALFAHGGVLISAQIYAGILSKEDALGAIPPYGGIVRI